MTGNPTHICKVCTKPVHNLCSQKLCKTLAGSDWGDGAAYEEVFLCSERCFPSNNEDELEFEDGDGDAGDEDESVDAI